MGDSQQRPAGNEILEAAARHGWSQEEVLIRRWGKVARHKVLAQILELLGQQPDRWMYQAEIARALENKEERVYQEIQHFKWSGVVDVERRGQRTYYKLSPGMADQYQQWLASQQPAGPQP